MSTYAFSDIHGNRELFNQIMAFFNPDDKIFFLGDAIDRGPDGWTIFKELIDDPRVIFICGNHEDMMYDALRTFRRLGLNGFSMARYAWNQNGNEPTLQGIANDDPDEVWAYLNRIPMLPLFQEYVNPNGDIIWLTHAGCDYEENLVNLTREDLLWDRSHFLSNMWFHDSPENLYIVHGHTPVPYLIEEMSYYTKLPDEDIQPGAYFYANGHKIDIDCGAHFTGSTVVLNLDTFEEHIFMTQDSVFNIE